MRLASLHPSLTQSIGVPGAVYTHQLVVDCPTCGSAFRIAINVVLNVPRPGCAGVWGLQLRRCHQVTAGMV